MIKVLIVDDSPTTLEYLQHIMEADKNISVIGTAKDGKEAVESVQKLHPDLVTMDIQMPRMDGYEATQKIMEQYPVPIVIVSACLIPEEVENTFRAIKAGAVAVVEKPRGPGHPDAELMAEKLLQTVKLMSEVRVVRRFRRKEMPKNRMQHSEYGKQNENSLSVSDKFPGSSEFPKTGSLNILNTDIVAIGASTGGPPIIRTILSNLKADFPVPILVVQHIARGFLRGLTDWLSKEISLPVRIPEHGETVRKGHVYFAPDDYHIGITRHGEIVLSRKFPADSLQPSVSHLFQSVAEAFGKRSVGILLTGMGKDGASELRIMREKGAVTVAQNKETSIVHGMPGEAINLGAAGYILSPEEIAALLNRIRS
ncbi:MAG: chemotaxis response regulator protein-glutamate methylesterase [Desulfobacteraceae bacterium IS3]|nr:MAG: chemotaxis response regulator protein-glutamate methylesterase [Desulfobacteraceae bacterium IS3]